MSEKLAINGGEKVVTESWPDWPILTEQDEKVVLDALRGTGRDVVARGGVIGAFEEVFAEYQGKKYCLALNGGTSALDLAVMIAGVQPGDEVITSPYSWGATVGAIPHGNGIPVFADIKLDTLNLDPDSVREKITDRTKAIIVVHIYGQAADMDELMAIADEHGLILIEDCAQAHGTLYKGRKVGSIGHIGCFSFQASKHVPAIEGGALVTDDDDMYQHALVLAMHPMRQGQEVESETWRRYVDSTGWNYRMHPLAAALGKSRLQFLDERNVQRRKNIDRLCDLLEDVPGVTPPAKLPDRRPTYHMVAMSYNAEELGGLPKSKFIEAVNAEGAPLGAYVGTPFHLRPRFQDRYYYGKGCPWECPFASRVVTYKEGDCPNAERYCRESELTLFAGGLVGDCSKLVDQLAAAYKKVAENIDQIPS